VGRIPSGYARLPIYKKSTRPSTRRWVGEVQSRSPDSRISLIPGLPFPRQAESGVFWDSSPVTVAGAVSASHGLPGALNPELSFQRTTIIYAAARPLSISQIRRSRNKPEWRVDRPPSRRAAGRRPIRGNGWIRLQNVSVTPGKKEAGTLRFHRVSSSQPSQIYIRGNAGLSCRLKGKTKIDLGRAVGFFDFRFHFPQRYLIFYHSSVLFCKSFFQVSKKAAQRGSLGLFSLVTDRFLT
jgi:hypothetical protein